MSKKGLLSEIETSEKQIVVILVQFYKFGDDHGIVSEGWYHTILALRGYVK